MPNTSIAISLPLLHRYDSCDSKLSESGRVMKLRNVFTSKINTKISLKGRFSVPCFKLKTKLVEINILLFTGNMSSAGSRGSSHFSTASAQSGSSGNEPTAGELSDGTSLECHSNDVPRTYRERTQAWWSVGEYLENGRTKPLTHQSAKLTLTGNRVFGNNYSEDLWDLSDSLLELYEANQNANLTATLQLTKKSKILDRDVNVQEWLSKDTTHGFLRVFAPDAEYSKSQLVPCTLSTSAHKVCLLLGISLNALHVQLNGDVIRRLDPYEHPLVLQNEYLAGLGYNDIIRIQEEGPNVDLGYLIRFYAGAFKLYYSIHKTLFQEHFF